MLAAPENNIFIVGDDDQSIYRFRGAKPEIMLNFPKEFKDTKTILLDQNFRCTGNIVKAAELVIRHNQMRFQKNMKEVKESGDKIELHTFANQPQECAHIHKKVTGVHQRGLPVQRYCHFISDKYRCTAVG